MATSRLSYLDQPDQVRAVLSPLRLRLLDRLREPASATQLAAALRLPRQRVNYHLRELEKAGLIELVEERKRRGCTERILRAAAQSYLVDPAVLSAHDSRAFTRIQDQYAAEHLVEVAAGTMRDVARMKTAADGAGKRLLTFTVEAEVRFDTLADVHRFTDALTAAIRDTVAAFDTPAGRAYRLVAGGHPKPAPSKETSDD